jgi:nucleotide-binding universal stress UspA family protein
VIETILVATDFSDGSQRALEYAEFLALKTGARLLLLHSIEPVLLAGTEEDEELLELAKELEQKAREQLDHMAAALQARGVRAEGRTEVGHAFTVFEQVCREVSPQLVVLGSHGLTQGKEAFVGTFSHQVFFLSTVPALFVR